MTVFFRTRLHQNSVGDSGSLYLNALFYAVVVIMLTGFGELASTIQRLPVLVRQRDMLFAPAWAYSVSAMVLSIPVSVLECGIFTCMTYYVTGYAPEASRFFKQFLLLFLIQQQAGGMFRFIGGICRTITLGYTLGWIVLLIFFMLGGFIMPRPSLPIWWRWGYWISNLSYSVNAIAVNELRAPRWDKVCLSFPYPSSRRWTNSNDRDICFPREKYKLLGYFSYSAKLSFAPQMPAARPCFINSRSECRC